MFQTKGPCPSCGSSDARSTYEDGHTYCFSCDLFTPAPDDFDTPGVTTETVSAHSEDYVDLPERMLFADTLRKFQYSVSQDGVHTAPFYQKGKLVAKKSRHPEKEFRVSGKLPGLWGTHVWEAGGKRLVITEGELDALSYCQASNKTWPVVSLPNGAQGAVKAVKQDLEFVESFDSVVLLFDNDEAGVAAANAVAELLTPGKAKIADLPLKDASDMLVAGRTKELVSAVYNAKTFRPDGVLSGAEISLNDLMTKTPAGLPMKYTELTAMLRGWRPAELWMLCAGSGVGKTTLARELGFHLQKDHGVRGGWIPLEESLQKAATALIALDNNIPVGQLMEEPSRLDREKWQASKVAVVDDAYFYDSWGSSEIDSIISKIRYLAVGCDCKLIILDHISIVISGLETSDERKTLDLLMTKLRQLIEQTGVGVIAICHLKRVNGKAFTEGSAVSLSDLRGSASVEQLSDVVIACERDQQSSGEDNTDPNVVQFRILKNRPHGIVGLAGGARYDAVTGRLQPHDIDGTSEISAEDKTFANAF